jgi:hypothetical protein
MTNFPSRTARFGPGVARLFTVLLGCAGLVSGAYMFPIFWGQSSLEHTAAQVIEGVPFATDELIKSMPAMEAAEQASLCRLQGLRSAAIIRLRLAKDVIAASERDQIDSSLSALRDSIRRSLDCSPADPFLWSVLFWLENTMNGFSPDHFEFLRLSYQLGPNEGWIAVKRNELALALFGQLPPDLRQLAIDEFAKLLNSGFLTESVAIFTGPGWPIRDFLLPRLTSVSDVQREAFARELYRRGYVVNVPGVNDIERRPWHR